MKLRRTLLMLLGLWVAVGIVLAPARPMPGMDMGTGFPAVPTSGQAEATVGMLEHPAPETTGHEAHRHEATAHHETAPTKTQSPERPAAESEPSGHDHLARCVLCVVGAGMLALIVVIVWTSSLPLTYTFDLNPFVGPQRFRHYRSRAPPTVASS